MPIWAIIPVKQLAQSKSRLASVLTPPQRAQLVTQLLAQQLATLQQVAAVEQTLVVSSDEVVLAQARAQGTAVLPEAASRGINVAVRAAVQLAAGNGITAVLILPVDLPFLQSPDIEQIIETAYGTESAQPNMVICPDGLAKGTNALFMPPLSTFAFQYGANSFVKHLREAKRRQLTPRILQLPRLMFDLDTIDDWYAYQQAFALSASQLSS